MKPVDLLPRSLEEFKRAYGEFSNGIDVTLTKKIEAHGYPDEETTQVSIEAEPDIAADVGEQLYDSYEAHRQETLALLREERHQMIYDSTPLPPDEAPDTGAYVR